MSDIPAVLVLDELCFKWSKLPRAPLEEYQQCKGWVWMNSKEEIVSTVLYIPRAEGWYLFLVCTHSDFRGQGMASTMLKSFASAADLMGTTCETRVEDGNEKVIPMYEKIGFYDTKEVSSYESHILWRK